MIGYVCSCGYATDDPRQAFLHRSTDGSNIHQVKPLEGPRLTGIEKMFMGEEIMQIHLVRA